LVVFFAVEINEGAYWAATMRIAREDTSAATGVLNTGGNLGGLICQPVVAFLSGNGQWSLVFISGAAFALFAALLWTRIDSGRLVKSGRNLSSVLELARHT
jgi:nitrate/nitrite transporter NarK